MLEIAIRLSFLEKNLIPRNGLPFVNLLFSFAFITRSQNFGISLKIFSTTKFFIFSFF